MNLMLRIAWQYGIDYDVIFNPTKSKLVVFGNYGKIDGSVLFGQTVLAASTESCEMHLGNELGPSMSKEYILKCVHTFMRRVNVLCSRFKFITSSTRYYFLTLIACLFMDASSGILITNTLSSFI